MKPKTALFFFVLSYTPFFLFGETREMWDFTATDDTSLHSARSNLGNTFITAASPIAKIRNNEAEFSYDGSSKHTFRQTAFKGAAITTGICELSWVFTKVDFSRTAANNGSGNLGFDVRDLKGTRQNNKDDVVFGGIRLRFEKNKILIQYKPQGNKNFESLYSIPKVKLDAPLQVRLRFDLDKPSEVGALQVFLKEGDAEAFCVLENGILPAGAVIDGFRTAQQTINGNNSWQVGDVVCVDDFTLTVE